MNLLIDSRDSQLRESLIEAGALSSAKISGLTHPRFRTGDVIRLPELLAQNSESINYDAWFYHASSRYGLLYIPNIHLNFTPLPPETFTYEEGKELEEKFLFPLGLSNDALAMVTFAPHLDLSPGLTAKLSSLSPIRKIHSFLQKFDKLNHLKSARRRIG